MSVSASQNAALGSEELLNAQMNSLLDHFCSTSVGDAVSAEDEVDALLDGLLGHGASSSGMPFCGKGISAPSNAPPAAFAPSLSAAPAQSKLPPLELPNAQDNLAAVAVWDALLTSARLVLESARGNASSACDSNRDGHSRSALRHGGRSSSSGSTSADNQCPPRPPPEEPAGLEVRTMHCLAADHQELSDVEALNSQMDVLLDRLCSSREDPFSADVDALLDGFLMHAAANGSRSRIKTTQAPAPMTTSQPSAPNVPPRLPLLEVQRGQDGSIGAAPAWDALLSSARLLVESARSSTVTTREPTARSCVPHGRASSAVLAQGDPRLLADLDADSASDSTEEERQRHFSDCEPPGRCWATPPAGQARTHTAIDEGSGNGTVDSAAVDSAAVAPPTPTSPRMPSARRELLSKLAEMDDQDEMRELMRKFILRTRERFLQACEEDAARNQQNSQEPSELAEAMFVQGSVCEDDGGASVWSCDSCSDDSSMT